MAARGRGRPGCGAGDDAVEAEEVVWWRGMCFVADNEEATAWGGEAGGRGWDGGAGVEGSVFLVLVVGPDALEAGGDGTEDLGFELGGVVFEAADAPAEKTHEVGADHGGPVHEEFLEGLLGEEPVEADDLFASVDDSEDVPGCVYEG